MRGTGEFGEVIPKLAIHRGRRFGEKDRDGLPRQSSGNRQFTNQDGMRFRETGGGGCAAWNRSTPLPSLATEKRPLRNFDARG